MMTAEATAPARKGHKQTRRRNRGRLLAPLGIAASFALVAAACGGDDDTETTPAAPDYMGDGSLGEVRVSGGEAIQVRSLNAITGDVAFLGLPMQRAIEMAIDDFGPIQGFDVDMGTGLDDLCSAEGGQAAAQTIAADDRVVGIIGTSCSGAAVAASPLISAANMVMISPSNTSPSLTSDLAGTPGEAYNPGYYRTAHNDLIQGAAVAEFVYEDRGLTTAAAIHDGDPYTQGLAQSFSNSFEALGGEMTGFSGINKEDTDMVPVLTEIAAGSPQALFFPIFQPAGDFVADQAPGVSGLEGAALLGADGLLVESLAYAVLQAGPEHRRWLAGRGRRVRRDRGRPRVTVRDDGAAVTVTLDRPRLLNLFDAAMRDELAEVLKALGAGSDRRPVVLTGAGGAFCAGGDPAEFGTVDDPVWAHLIRSAASVARPLAAVAPRVTALVDGPCVGAGVELAAFCGAVRATRRARFRLPELSMGLICGAGGMVSIPRRIGRQRTLEWLLTGAELDPDTALRWGLADEIADESS